MSESDEAQGRLPAWGAWMAPAAILTGLSLGVGLDSILGAVASAFGTPFGHLTPAVSLIGDLLFDLAFVGAALFFAVRHGGARAVDFGYVRPVWRRAVRGVLLAGLGYYLLTLIYATLFTLHGRDKLPSELGVDNSTAALVGAALFVCVVAPIAEEFFFRGFLFGVLRRWCGPWGAAGLTSVLFGLVHAGSASPQYLIPLGFFGFVLCLLRWRTGSLYPSMALHSLNNALALGVNDLHWGILGIFFVMTCALATIGGLTLPLSRPAQEPLRGGPADGHPLESTA